MVEQVQTVAQVEDRADDEGVGDVGCRATFALGKQLGVVQRPVRVVLPEVGAAAEPVVGVGAGPQFCFAGKDGLAYSPVAPMEPEDERPMPLL